MKKTRKKFQAALKKANITLYQLAKIVGVGVPVAYYWLWGDSVPAIGNLIKIKNALNISADEVLEMFLENATD